ncbi:sigma-E processing peptidase SpoIIGA [Halobacteroides halobius DSM 5150]|uniref:Sporulation sigma-E factor-processing peptidase n=1 Tax=Halobacteroides halobius (strain ATCC 35273 / DSM 5150 / MD-1) TaxID=748449 RepID=L0K8T4_HALHC|nr:sigma-E processing peptidase SpoIIGA [Halobacteroides halobius]AGB41697.1 sigma-E processing peptidase SpoIIGA [Halobacteroides halobius DSM 5150]
MELVVYLDLLAAVNLVMNYLLLWATAKLAELNYKIWRLFLTSLLGTIYTVLIILPQFSYLNQIPIHFLLSVLMIFVSFAPLDYRLFFKALGYLYLITFVTAGAILALYNLTGGSPLNSLALVLNISPDNLWIIIYGFILIIIIGKFGWMLIRQKLFPNIFSVLISIDFDGDSQQIKALVDTGNQLEDPLTKTPVIIVEVEVLLEILPERIKDAFCKYNYNSDQLLDEMIDTCWANRFRLIPFSSIGKQDGMLVGFRPDKVTIKAEDEVFTTSDVIIALQSRSLDNDEYQALLNPQVFRATN